MASDSIRTFVAVNVGDETRRRLEELSADLSRELVGFKWTKPEQLHVTLAFLGNVEAQKVAGLNAAVEAAVRSVGTFDIHWRGVGGFPKPNRAHILWVGVGAGVEALYALQRSLVAALASAGFSSDDRFTPHITFARAKRFGGRSADLRPAIERFRSAEFGVDRVSALVVMRSDCRPSGSIYTPLASVPLSVEYNEQGPQG
jgi:2'-5' RNA ligase